MQDFINEGFITSHTIRFGEPTSGRISIEGEIRCRGDLRIAVVKKLVILKGSGPTALVQTAEYSYSTYVEGRGNVLRYCGPTQHRPYHHLHRYDFLGTWAEKRPALEIPDVNDVPTLGDVIEEVRDLFYSPEFDRMS